VDVKNPLINDHRLAEVFELFLGFYTVSTQSDSKVSVWYSLLVLQMKPTGCNLGPVKSLAVWSPTWLHPDYILVLLLTNFFNKKNKKPPHDQQLSHVLMLSWS